MPGGMVIVGGGMAGARAIVSLRANGYDGAVTLVSEEDHLPYDRPPLSKAVITEETEPSPTALLDRAMLESLKAKLIGGTSVIGIDRERQQLHLSTGAALAYDKLLIATGSKPRRLNLPGGALAFTLRDFGDGLRLRQSIRESASVAIIGGGFIGLELASSARKLGVEVTVIEAQPRILMRGVPPEIAAAVHTRHQAAGVHMLTGTGVAAIELAGVTLSDGRTVKADLTIAGIGAAPETALAAAAGLAAENGIACDAMLRTDDPNIFAAGDCCSFPHPLFGGKRMRLEAWRNATDQANTATANMLGAETPHMAVPWFWSDQYDLSLQIAGVPSDGTETVRRQVSDQAFIIFHRDAAGRLVGASGIGPGNAIARDVKLAEMLIAKSMSPASVALADPAASLKSLLKS
jgi:3-phenylpropionate/trans-cinnamate dioxygenase ferredoxin reductase subunit